jgi:hypothetical protein
VQPLLLHDGLTVNPQAPSALCMVLVALFLSIAEMINLVHWVHLDDDFAER